MLCVQQRKEIISVMIFAICFNDTAWIFMIESGRITIRGVYLSKMIQIDFNLNYCNYAFWLFIYLQIWIAETHTVIGTWALVLKLISLHGKGQLQLLFRIRSSYFQTWVFFLWNGSCIHSRYLIYNRYKIPYPEIVRISFLNREPSK